MHGKSYDTEKYKCLLTKNTGKWELDITVVGDPVVLAVREPLYGDTGRVDLAGLAGLPRKRGHLHSCHVHKPRGNFRVVMDRGEKSLYYTCTLTQRWFG